MVAMIFRPRCAIDLQSIRFGGSVIEGDQTLARVGVCVPVSRSHGSASGPATAQNRAGKAAAASGESRGEIQSVDRGCGQWHESARFRGEAIERAAGRVEGLPPAQSQQFLGGLRDLVFHRTLRTFSHALSGIHVAQVLTIAK
jgi:hypothetical protein